MEINIFKINFLFVMGLTKSRKHDSVLTTLCLCWPCNCMTIDSQGCFMQYCIEYPLLSVKSSNCSLIKKNWVCVIALYTNFKDTHNISVSQIIRILPVMTNGRCIMLGIECYHFIRFQLSHVLMTLILVLACTICDLTFCKLRLGTWDLWFPL